MMKNAAFILVSFGIFLSAAIAASGQTYAPQKTPLKQPVSIEKPTPKQHNEADTSFIG